MGSPVRPFTTYISSSTSYILILIVSVGASVWDTLLFSYTTKVVMLGYTSTSLEIADLPIVPGDMRATTIYANMRAATRRFQQLRIGSWSPKPGSGWTMGWRLARVNAGPLVLIASLAALAAVLFYAPAYFLKQVVAYVERDAKREDRAWGWVYCVGLFFSNAICQLGESCIFFAVNVRALISFIK